MNKRIELPWALPKRPGFKGEAPGLYFHYYLTRAEAEKSLAWCKRNKKWCAPIEYRPGECHQLGGVL